MARCPQVEILDLKAELSEVRSALRLAKDMMIANGLSLPHTFEVIDNALIVEIITDEDYPAPPEDQ